MSNYTNSKLEREFEDRIGWENIRAANEAIGKFLDFTPTVNYAVCKDGNCCYSPANVDNLFSTEYSQKSECDRWLKEQKDRFPEGWVTKEGYQTTRLEFWPQFHADWNHLMEAVRRLHFKNIDCCLSTNRFLTWDDVCNAIKETTLPIPDMAGKKGQQCDCGKNKICRKCLNEKVSITSK